ncbi:type II toxin-antitoxin system RelB/DinJ family antitoxin [Psychrobacter sp. AOP22-C1-22]|jgi:addiction module RelB/DinJ family antitoxin|uniref:type II toxin-antitoxin system RelB/DinJ family antitoxin n=1 Tax=Psychrobacter TaxID=497 RepID=UPI00097E7AF5|nr:MULTISPECIES: type II toxin-antitoxin system RelB/DinJ family antitoxin [unclassified Psychrobacter]PAT62110.1 type II toxin-antitoxin system antitoxin, RelB/DinJ family [Psychrobacter sp. JB193]SJN22908.1 DNA-damage-inducible protein J [Psychrobacter sp. JB385]
MSTTNYNIRLDQELKEKAFSVLEGYGLTPSQAIKLFLNQVAETNSVPLSFDYQAILSTNTLKKSSGNHRSQNKD